jgi:hypothetical protein
MGFVAIHTYPMVMWVLSEAETIPHSEGAPLYQSLKLGACESC